MSNIKPINRLVNNIIESQKRITVDIWEASKPEAREIALLREQFIQPIVQLTANNVSNNVAIRNVLQKIKSKNFSDRYIETAYKLGRDGKLPSRSTIQRWLSNHHQHGRNGLLDSYTGRVRKDKGWESLAIQLYNIPSKPSYAGVAEVLRTEYGFEDATDHSVRRYLQNLPSTLNDSSPLRLGKHYHQQNRGRYVTRDPSNVGVGDIYEGDGHTVDCYVAHPLSGKPYRPELTVWIDIRSQYVVGWYLSDAESSLSTLFALSNALIKHDHVPAIVHVDNGSGFKSKVMNDASTGFYQQFSIDAKFSIPGNSKGKGLIEGFFGPYRNNHDKFFNNGQDYCGSDMAPEINRRLQDQLKSDNRKLKSLKEYRDSVARYIDNYNNRPKKVLDNQSPAQLWQSLVRTPLETPSVAVVRPSVMRTVSRCCVRLHNRSYEHIDLQHYDTRDMRVQYDLHNDAIVWIYDDKNRLICEAPLKAKKPWIPTSRLDEAKEKRKKGRLQRLEAKRQQIEQEDKKPIDINERLSGIEDLTGDYIEAELDQPSIEDRIQFSQLISDDDNEE